MHLDYGQLEFVCVANAGEGEGERDVESTPWAHLVKAIHQSFFPVGNLDPHSQEFLRLSYSPNLVS